MSGLPAIGCGFLTWLLLPNHPADAQFLLPEEKMWIAEKLWQEGESKSGTHERTAWHALANPRVWHLACISFTYLIGLYAMGFWMPQALVRFGWPWRCGQASCCHSTVFLAHSGHCQASSCRDCQRPAAIAFINSIGNLGGFVGPGNWNTNEAR
jgi:hypothetical protein